MNGNLQFSFQKPILNFIVTVNLLRVNGLQLKKGYLSQVSCIMNEYRPQADVLYCVGWYLKLGLSAFS